MPSKSMSPMPMQPKIGDASLKFGPDWLRALSSDSGSTGGTGPSGGGWSGGSGGGGGTGIVGGGGSNRDYSSVSSSSIQYQQSYQQHHVHQNQGREGRGSTPPGMSSNPNRFKISEHSYTREEMLTLYDKSFTPPPCLDKFQTLYVEKMQPPLAFSQPSEEEIRIWHIPQPESSRQGGSGPITVGRGGYAIRGRGSGIERGRGGRGRGGGGGYYGRPHEEEDRSFSRPRTFERSQSAHERVWAERNGNLSGGPGPSPPEDGGARGGSWRTRESYGGGGGGGGGGAGGGGGGGRRHEDDNDGWRKPRWRREDDEDAPRSAGGRRLHKSWSEDGAQDNLPEWARDNPCEESGTFDSSGAFHGEDRNSSKNNSFDSKGVGDGKSKESKNESEPHGSQNDRVQKRTPERGDNMKAVIPPAVQEEIEPPIENDHYNPSSYRNHDISDKYPTNSHSQNSNNILDKKSDLGHREDNMTTSSPSQGKHQSQQQSSHHHVLEHSHNQSHTVLSQSQQHHQNVKSDHLGRPESLTNQKQSIDIRASKTVSSIQRHTEEEHYRSMTEEADNLVAKLIEEDGSGSRVTSAIPHSLNNQNVSYSQAQINVVNASSSATTVTINSMSATVTGNPHPGVVSGVPANVVPNVPSLPPQTSSPPASMDIWFYRDPQGSVQGPFATHEMAQWYTQGYFTGNLLLRRECDKIFITLAEMGKLYSRNPFAAHSESPPPAPIPEPNSSALVDHIQDGNIQAQFHQRQQQQQQQQLAQQNILREQQQQQQYLMNISHGGVRKEEGWQGSTIQTTQHQASRTNTATVGLTPEQIMLLNYAKAHGPNIENSNNPIEHLQALFQRQAQQLKNSGEPPHTQPNIKPEFLNPHIQQQMTTPMDVRKSPIPPSDPIQSLVQQLTNMANTQQHKINTNAKMDPINQWGMNSTPNSVHQHAPQQPQQQQWMQNSSGPVWDYREQLLKAQKLQEEELLLRRRKEEEEKERKRLQEEEEERKRQEEQQRQEAEEREREKQRKIREEQYLLQKQQEELLKQQHEAELARQKEMARQKELILQQQRLQQQQLEQQRLEQQRQEQQRLEQQRLEQQRQEQQRLEQQRQEQQRLEQQRLEQQRQEQQRLEQQQLLEQQQRERERQEQQAKLQQQQDQQRFSWNSSMQPQNPSGQARTLLEIQQEEAVKQQQEELMRQQMLKKKQQLQQQEQLRQQQQGKGGLSLKWAQGAAPQPKVAIKSLTEIQAEEQAKLSKQQQKEREQRAMIQQHHQQQQAWTSHLTWANRASLNAPNPSNKTNGGIWDEPVLTSNTSNSSGGKQGKTTSPSSNNQNQTMSATIQNQLSNNISQSQNQPQNAMHMNSSKRSKESEDVFMKMFHDQTMHGKVPQTNFQDDFTRWCFESVESIGGGSVDIPTFVAFLKEVESPYEVGDYVRSYLGDGREAREFGRDFLERRSRWKNARKEKDDGGAFEDNLCRPASAINPNQNDFQEVKVRKSKMRSEYQSFGVSGVGQAEDEGRGDETYYHQGLDEHQEHGFMVAKSKKGKKGKMQKVDARILGFNVTAAPDRLNVGKRDYGDGTD